MVDEDIQCPYDSSLSTSLFGIMILNAELKSTKSILSYRCCVFSGESGLFCTESHTYGFLSPWQANCCWSRSAGTMSLMCVSTCAKHFEVMGESNWLKGQVTVGSLGMGMMVVDLRLVEVLHMDCIDKSLKMCVSTTAG